MKARLLFAGDLHKLHKDISTILGYVKCTTAVQQKLMALMIEKCITHFFSLGDWYHKGYSSDISASLADVDLDTRMSEQLNGNFFGVIGNHVRLNMDSNPELHLIQPHATLKSRRTVARDFQIMKTPTIVRIGTVQISLMHTSDLITDVEQYKPTREEGVTYHIALFHTPLIIPGKELARTNMLYNASTNTKIARTLEGVDFAICGDIHLPLGQFNVETSTGCCTVCCPGSLTNTDAGMESRHYSINIPIITIEDDDTVSIEYTNFDLLTKLLSFENKEDNGKEKLKTTRGHATPIDKTTLLASGAVITGVDSMSFSDFIKVRNYNESEREIIRTILDYPEDINKLVLAYQSGSLNGGQL